MIEVVVSLDLNWAVVFGRLFGNHINRDVVSKVCNNRFSERYEPFEIGLREEFSMVG